MNSASPRIVTANLAVTMDGRYDGPGGPGDLSAIVPYAVTETGRHHLSRIHQNATTALLGRGNAEGFLSFWPTVADDDTADPRDRAYAKWLVDVEKVVLSSRLETAPWPNARTVDAPAAEVVAGLKANEGGEILVNSSPTVIKDLLAADLIDRLYLLVCPQVAGGGRRLFEDGLPASKWRVADSQAGETGELSLVFDRLT